MVKQSDKKISKIKLKNQEIEPYGKSWGDSDARYIPLRGSLAW